MPQPKLDYDAQDTANLTLSGSDVMAWANLGVGTATLVKQVAVGPVSGSRTVFGRNGLYFTSAGFRGMRFQGPTDDFANPSMVYVAVRLDDISGHSSVFTNLSTGADLGFNSPNKAFLTGDSSHYVEATTMNTSADHIVTFVLNGASSKIRIDSGSWVTGDAGSGELFFTGGSGGPYICPSVPEMVIGRIVMFDSVLSDGDDATVYAAILAGDPVGTPDPLTVALTPATVTASALALARSVATPIILTPATVVTSARPLVVSYPASLALTPATVVVRASHVGMIRVGGEGASPVPTAGFIGWRWDDETLGEQVPGGVDITGIRRFCGHFQNTGGLLVVETNYFPVVGPWYSISLNLSALSSDDNPVRISFGLVGFDSSYLTQTFYTSDLYPSKRVIQSALIGNVVTLITDGPHDYHLGDDIVVSGLGTPYDGEFVISSLAGGQDVVSYALTHADIPIDIAGGIITAKRDISVPANTGSATQGYMHLTGLVPVDADVTTEMCLRIEASPNCSDLWLDNCMVDPHEGMYEYFDGNSKVSFISDFHWMGGPEKYQNRHFSLWYNNYTNTRQRLISEWDTEDDVYKPGLVEEWAPTGANIIPHWNAVTSFTPLNWQGDAFYEIRDPAGTPVSTPTTRKSFQGVPWPPA